MKSFHPILRQVGTNQMQSTVYDTAWLARLGDLNRPMSNRALEWICAHQLPDGAWGAPEPMYYHDRVICTLAAMTALTRRGRRAADKDQINRGLQALEQITSLATQGLNADPNGATIGFEMIVPSLINEAVALGIIKHQGDRILGRLTKLRQAKLAALNGYKISRHVTAAFSAEMAGLDGMSLLDLQNLQECNGSVGDSPSATAYYLLHIRPDDRQAMQFLQQVVRPDGGAPDISPFDVFEVAWALWNLSLLGKPDPETLALCRPHLDMLRSAWKPGEGIAQAVLFSPRDGDDSSLVYEVLQRYGCPVDLEGVMHWEKEDCFRCFPLEANSSISTNVHALAALRHAGLPAGHPAVQKTAAFLSRMQTSSGYWFDKWHASPYYTTAHAVIAATGYIEGMAEKAVDWIRLTQRPDGSWGYYMPTAEETSYAVQALVLWRRSGGDVPPGMIPLARRWLAAHAEPPYPPLWIGKCLYSPTNVVQSAIVSALALSESEK